MLELTLRLVFSLAVVVGLLLILARLGARRFRGSADALVRVVHRQPLSRTSSVSVVTVGSRVLVLGTTEHQVSVLTELDPEELVTDLPVPDDLEGLGSLGELGPAATTTAGTGPAAGHPGAPATPLAGSVLSPGTWRQALAAFSQGGGRRP